MSGNTLMTGFMTYITSIGHSIDLSRAASHLSQDRPVGKRRACGTFEEFHITLFDDGGVWVEFLATDQQHRQLLRVAEFLQSLFLEQRITTDMTNLLLNAKTIQSTIPPHLILHSNLETRKRLGANANLNISRLLLHWLVSNETGDEWKTKVKDFGHTLGGLAYASLSAPLKDEYAAIDALKAFMKSNGIGLLSQVTAGSGEIMRLMIDESFSCSGIGAVGNRLCYLEAGIISGFFSKYYRSSINCEEERCWGLGGDHCEFSITLGEEG